MTTYLPSPKVTVASPVPTSDMLRVAAFTCQGLDDLSRALGFSVAVVAAVEDTDRHLRRLRDLWYGSGVPKGWMDWFEPFDFDNWLYRDWRKTTIDERWFGGMPHPLSTCVDDGDLVLRLPIGIGKATYTAAFRDALSGLRFEVVARHPSRCVKRHHARRPVIVTSRYSRASAGDPTPVEVEDIIMFEPRIFPRIADVAFSTLVRLIATAGTA